MYELRPYQRKFIDQILKAMLTEENVLMQLPTGGGKTVIFCSLIKELLLDYPNMRILVLAHREILVKQSALKMREVDPTLQISLACASVSPVNRHSLWATNLTIGSVQTVANLINDIPPYDLIIVDEAHKIPPLRLDEQNKLIHTNGKASLYMQVINGFRKFKTDMRLLGVTATPFRLGHGYIYGHQCKNNHKNIFDTLTCQMKISDLQSDGYLTAYRAKEAENISAELMEVSVRGGEYVESELATIMSRQVHLDNAIKAYRDFGEARKHGVIFAVSIAHAVSLKNRFIDAGYSCGAIHSQMKKDDRESELKKFKTGEYQFIANVGVLTEGWDEPHVDIILFCRPTKSLDLYIQMIGRGLRPFKDKTDLLILDLANNCTAHGDPDEPNISTPYSRNFLIQSQDDKSKGKTCPNCKLVVAYHKMMCTCGHKWIEELQEIQNKVDLRVLDWSPQLYRLDDYSFFDFISKKGNKMVMVKLECRLAGEINPTLANFFLDVEGNASDYGSLKFIHFWNKYGVGDIPKTIEEFMQRCNEVDLPSTAMLKQTGKYYNVVNFIDEVENYENKRKRTA